MASFTSTGWVAGETVSVFLVSLTPPGGATGSAVTTATADSAGAAAFSGLTEDTQYIASGGTSNRTARFRVPTPVSAQSGSANVFLVQTDSGYPERGDGAAPMFWIGWDDPSDLMAELDLYVPIPEPS